MRARLKAGDPDMASDELQVAIDRVEGRRREIEATLPEAKTQSR